MLKLSSLLLILIVTLVNTAHGQDDGPYLRYQEGKPYLLSVVSGKALAVEVKKEFKVTFADHPDWDFSVRLKKKIETEPSVYPAADRIFAVSDIEGEFEPLRRLLAAGGVTDQDYNWTYGKGHLVICGDLFDRGEQVAEYIWLLYALEEKAKKAGGYVHVVLGNHDIMNLSGDLRYLKPKYLASAKTMGLDYMQLYDEQSELGRWLRSKNIMEKIGDQLFLHAGISPQVAALNKTIQELNELSRPHYDTKTSLVPPALKVLFGDGSPFWYRGYFTEPKISAEQLEDVLKTFHVSRIIAGHTILESNVGYYYGGKVLGIDVNQHEGRHQAAVYESGLWYKLDDLGNRTRL